VITWPGHNPAGSILHRHLGHNRYRSLLMSADAKLQELGLPLPPAPKPMGVYKPIVIVGNLAYLSGHGPLKEDGSLITGRVGEDMDVEGGYAAARETGLALLATIRNALGSLDRVVRVVKTLGFVNSTDDFVDQPKVINGCSDLFAELYGTETGVGARSALPSNTLPGGIAVEIEMIIEITS
jgi:enamine deaminase RidA (YjgF/YER057c/UK114 family)|tara:strand:- start:307 stop:852 length:546 start_codon:yes stop_codon:yes gene_type:complete